MIPGSWPTPRDSHSTRSGQFCKSCTAPIHEQSHQSRTSRCSPYPSRAGVGAAVGVGAAAGVGDSEGRSPRSRCRGCSSLFGLHNRRRRTHHPRKRCTCLSRFGLHTEGRSPRSRSRCHPCRKHTQLRARHRRMNHQRLHPRQRKFCRYLSRFGNKPRTRRFVPPCRAAGIRSARFHGSVWPAWT
jgi:hypothetical protein